MAKGREKKEWWRLKRVWVGCAVVILAVVFGIAQPILWRWWIGTDPPAGAISVSVLLATILALVALGVTAFGWGAYKIMSDRLETTTGERIRNEATRDIAALAADIGYTCGELHIHLLNEAIRLSVLAAGMGYSDGESHLLNEAIRLTRRAYYVYSHQLDETKPKNEEVMGSLRNNLAYYLALRGKEEDSREARGLAQWVHERSSAFPRHSQTWEETYTFVSQVYP